MKYIAYLLIPMFLLSCGKKNVSQDPKHSISPNGTLNTVSSEDGFDFKTDEAADFNDKGIEQAKKGEYEKAKDYFLKADKIEPNNVTLANNLGLVEMNLENPEKSAEYFEKAIAIDSNYFKTFDNYCLLLYKQKDYKKSVEMADYVIKKCKNEELVFTANLNSIFSLIELKDCEKAKERFEIVKEGSTDTDYYDEQKRMIKEKLETCN